MKRVTEKALRSRQYVFESVSRERRPLFVRRVRLLRNSEALLAEKERRRASERVHASARNVAQRGEEVYSMLTAQGGSDKSGDVLSALYAEKHSLLLERERLLVFLERAAPTLQVVRK